MANHIPEEAGWLLDEFDADKFWGKVHYQGGFSYESDTLVDQRKVNGQCWLWGDAMGAKRYGRFQLLGRWYQAHRISFRDFGNKLSDDLDIDHLCRNTRCVRPSHLEAVTVSENIQRGKLALKNRTHCKHGHELSEGNIVARKRGNGFVNACRTCLADSKHKTYIRARAARQEMSASA